LLKLPFNKYVIISFFLDRGW